MHGYQLTFFTQQDRKHQGISLAQWLLEEARNIGISGATLIQASEGFGTTGKSVPLISSNLPTSP